jgi:hypothetical protein
MRYVDAAKRYVAEGFRSIISSNHSGIRSLDDALGEFESETVSSVVRYKFSMPRSANRTRAFFNFSFNLGSSTARPTHVSIVNGDVSDGKIWEIDETLPDGAYSLSAVLKSPCDNITIYANFVGIGYIRFKITSLVEAPLHRDLRVGFVIDPWIEREDPKWKDDYIWWFGKMDLALRKEGQSISTHYVMSDAVGDSWKKYRPTPEATHSLIKTSELLEIFPDPREGVRQQRSTISDQLNEQHQVRLSELIKRSFPWEPDFVVAMSDMQILKRSFPSSRILFRDALYCREPFQDELTSLDASGLYKSSSIGDICDGTSSQSSIPESFLSTFFPKTEFMSQLLARHKLAGAEFNLLPLQDSDHYNFFDESPFQRQIDLVDHVAGSSKGTIIFTQHPDKRELSGEEISELCRRHSNLFYIPELEFLKNPSAQLLPYASCVIGVSTGLLMQALLCGKPVHFMGNHALKSVVGNSEDTKELQLIAYEFLTRYFSSYTYLHDGAWLLTRLVAIHLHSIGELSASELAIDLPSNVFKKLDQGKRTVPTVLLD